MKDTPEIKPLPGIDGRWLLSLTEAGSIAVTCEDIHGGILYQQQGYHETAAEAIEAHNAQMDAVIAAVLRQVREEQGKAMKALFDSTTTPDPFAPENMGKRRFT